MKKSVSLLEDRLKGKETGPVLLCRELPSSLLLDFLLSLILHEKR